MPNSPHIIDVSEPNFERQVLAQSAERPVVVDFWAPWCGPCRALSPLLERLAAEAQGAFVLARLNVDDSPRLAAQYDVRGIPAVKAFRFGRVIDEFTGVQPEPKVRDFLRRLAPTPADLALREGQSFLAIRQWAAAEVAFHRVRAEQPDNAAAALGLVKSLVAQGRGCEALDVLEAFPRSDAAVFAQRLAPLAQALCEVETPDTPVAETDLDALFFHSLQLLRAGRLEAGLDGLLDVLRQDKRFRRGEPRLVMLAVFELLGDDDPATVAYRRELGSVLF